MADEIVLEWEIDRAMGAERVGDELVESEPGRPAGASLAEDLEPEDEDEGSGGEGGEGDEDDEG